MTQADIIHIVIVEDHPLFGHGLRRVIETEDDLKVVAQAKTGKEAVEMAETLQPDVMLMDINLPEMNGLEATRAIRQKYDHIGIIVITAYDNRNQLFYAIRAGAMAYFPKDIKADDLIAAIRAVAKGHYVIGDRIMNEPQAARWLLQQFEKHDHFEELDRIYKPLSPREMEILRYITAGYSNKEIAYQLHISRQTVKNHMSSILRKLAVNDRTQAAILALREGWIRLKDAGQQIIEEHDD